MRNTHPDSPNKFKYKPYTPVTTDTPDTAIIIVFFNFAQSIRLIQNILLVKQSLDAANIPAYYAEIAFGDLPLVLAPDAEHVYQTRTDSYMFYKENLINIMTDKIPAKYTKIVAIDADIMFGEPDWYATVSADLDKYDVIQPYSYAENMNPNYTCGHRLYPILLKEAHAIHPGYAWGFRREWLTSNRLYPYAVIGGGDNATAAMVTGGGLPQRMSSQQGSFAKWCRGCSGRARTGVSDIPIYHLPHGTMNNRQYIKRHDRIRTALAQCGVTNIDDVIEIRGDGIMEWIPAAREKMNAAMREYFIERQDDSAV
jgi:hypothetical protein